jgi:ArsR family transcriptional regulator, arsenate/arsenite/antimonite-responsive transcriptional repressor
MEQKRAIAALGALAQETRLELFRLLVTCGPEGLRAGVIAAEYGAMTELLAYLTENCCGKGTNCAPACNPADVFTKGETDETPARSRVG